MSRGPGVIVAVCAKQNVFQFAHVSAKAIKLSLKRNLAVPSIAKVITICDKLTTRSLEKLCWREFKGPVVIKSCGEISGSDVESVLGGLCVGAGNCSFGPTLASFTGVWKGTFGWSKGPGKLGSWGFLNWRRAPAPPLGARTRCGGGIWKYGRCPCFIPLRNFVKIRSMDIYRFVS